MSTTRPANLCVLLSGSGRTLMNLVKAIDEGRLDAKIALVIASKECLGAERARDAGLTTVVRTGQIPADELSALLKQHVIDLVVCAGYLKYLHVPTSYTGRIVNIHPSLLPAHGGPGMYGDHVHAAVIAAGDKESGCTVHLVDAIYDHGRNLAQARCPVLPTDDAHTLAARVFELECDLYPRTLQRLIETLV
jgi:phosphoribosylglycinamide formyltransferase-1